MANKRMFTKDITDSDAFLEMPLSSQALYFHICMNADDDGFCNNPKKIQRLICASEDDLKLLIAKRFLLAFDSGVVVVKHWRMHNTLRWDRYTPTVYQDELKLICVKENKAYTDNLENGNQLATSGIQTGNPGKHSIEENSIDKNRLVKHSIEEMLTPNEREFLEQTYQNIDILYDCIDRRGNLENIKKPLNYIVTIANQEGWKTY